MQAWFHDQETVLQPWGFKFSSTTRQLGQESSFIGTGLHNDL